jgi:hypothetical protein
VEICLGLQIARESDKSMSAFIAFKGRGAVGLDIRGGIGKDLGIAEIFIGLRIAIVIAALNPVYKRSVEVTEETSTAGSNEKAFKIEKGAAFELELEVLSIGVSLLVEITAWIFGWSVERKLAEIAGFKKKIVNEPLSSEEPVYYTPCLQPP